MSVIEGIGRVKNGAGTGHNRAGDLVSGHRTGEGQWSLTNQNNGAQFEASRQNGRGWNVTRTDGTTGEQSMGDFTVLSRPRPDGSTGVMVCDFDRDGFKPLSESDSDSGEPVTSTGDDGTVTTTTEDGYSVVQNPDNTMLTTTPGGYQISYDAANSTSTITDPQSGQSSTIWGDPHVAESDGGQWEWQSATSTYVLPDGTKVTMNSTGGDDANGYGTLQSMDIYSGAGTTHVDSSAAGTQVLTDSRPADEAQGDGDTYLGDRDVDSWYSVSGTEMAA
ncbi:MAG: DUF1521 domain-containing protein [Candidatus Eremiobacteraeota bacterium]|nr:DUF1521 domain-containing protein [Candidatus Eremiobacteraeota bacterium]